jgi:hypothetical protein
MNGTRTAQPDVSRRSLLKPGSAIGVVTVVSLVILISLFTSVPAHGVPVEVKTLEFTGFINGDTACYGGLAIMDLGTKDMVTDLWPLCGGGDFRAQTRTILHLTKQTRGHCLTDPGSDVRDLTWLCGGHYGVRTLWIEPDDDTLVLVQDVTSHVSAETTYVTATGVWSGKCEAVPDGATVLIDSIQEWWHQAGPHHVRMTYVQTATVDGQPDTLRVVKDVYYETSRELLFDQVLTISNIVVQYDPVGRVEHSECHLSLARASSTIPTLSEWGAIIFGTLLLASVAFYIWRRRRAVTA